MASTSIQTRAPRLAVLIDADNTSAQWAEAIFEEVATIGEASVRRIYGDFSGTLLVSWQQKLAAHAVVPHQQFAYTKGKNSSDIALVIDAMDLLHSERFDGFVLVSSDSDFTRLASRVREQGLDVFGIGRRSTPESFRKACKRFIFIENLLKAAGSEEAAHGGDRSASVREPETGEPATSPAAAAAPPAPPAAPCEPGRRAHPPPPKKTRPVLAPA
ncbi:MAG: NYN domain-containing protein, partial [Gammaproteobacteria bacterium]|nr:NYN domain-containing protein [Gammaproteobacteria bacterium]